MIFIFFRNGSGKNLTDFFSVYKHQEFSEMVVAAANLVTKHGIDNLDVDTDYFVNDHNFLHEGGRRKHRHDDDIMSMTGDADAEGMLKVSV